MVVCAAFLGMSLDGFIAGPDGDLTWLDQPANPTESDYGFFAFMDSIDAVIMGRNTFEFVANFDGPWPYSKPLVVATSTMTEVPPTAVDTELFSGSPGEILAMAEERSWSKLYVDGGALVTSFLTAGLLDELTVTVLPVVLGSGVPVFGDLDGYAWFELVESTVINNALIQNTYRRDRSPG